MSFFQTAFNNSIEQPSFSDTWPAPQPLIAKVMPEPYPIDSLPKIIGEAIQEVQGFVKAPLPLVASSAIGALSLAIQAHANVARAEMLTGPTSLFLLAIAESGERKTTTDCFFTQAIKAYEFAQAESAMPALALYNAEIASWNAKRDGLLAAIKQKSKEGKDASAGDRNLQALEQEKPEMPLTPRIILGDETPENLAWSLAKLWPSSGVISSEAGTVLGSHAMGKDSMVRNLSLLNVLWDGGSLSIGRKTTESFTVRDARLTLGLQIQEATLRSFFDNSKGLARGTGFLARFLVSWPESTQGTRFFSEPPENAPKLAAFNRRITEILTHPLKLKSRCGVEPVMLKLCKDAKEEWVGFHDALEVQLSDGGDLCEVRDVASKTADNAARLAALFEVFEHGLESKEISVDSFMSGAHIAAWHLSESRRFFGELAYPQEIVDAIKLDTWLIKHAIEHPAGIPKNLVRQKGPNPLRNKARLDAAIEFLQDNERLRLFKDRGCVKILVNPDLRGEK